MQNKGSWNTSTMASQSGKKIRRCLQDRRWTEGLHQGVHQDCTPQDNSGVKMLLSACFYTAVTSSKPPLNNCLYLQVPESLSKEQMQNHLLKPTTAERPSSCLQPSKRQACHRYT